MHSTASKMSLVTLDLSYKQSNISKRWRITFLSIEFEVLAQLTEYLSHIFSPSEQNNHLQLQQTAPLKIELKVNTTELNKKTRAK